MSMFLGLREYILLSLKEFPLIVSVGSLFLGLVEGNINLIMLSIGVLFVATFWAAIIGKILSFPLGWFDPNGWSWKIIASDVSPLLPETPTNGARGLVNVTPTYWLTMTLFFFTYLILNAVTLLTTPTASSKPSREDLEKEENRKSQAIMCLVLICAIGLTTVIGKIFLSGGETVLGGIVAAIVAGGSAYGWFMFLRQCGLGRLEDVFGIQSRILPGSATKDQPVVCVPN